MPKMSGRRSDWRERLCANPSRMEQELAIKLQDDRIHYQTQVEIPVTTADFYFQLESRPLLVFVDGRVHLGNTDGERRGATITLTEERIQNLRTILQWLLRQEKRPTVRGNPKRSRKRIVRECCDGPRACSTTCQPYERYNAQEHYD